SNPTNWASDVLPVPGDDLIFPSAAARTQTTNDFPAGTVFNSITIGGVNYDLQGTNLTLNNGISVTNTTGNVNVRVPILLASNQTFSVAPSNIAAQVTL